MSTTPPPAEAPGPLRPREWAILAAITLIGALLRLDQIGAQLVADDEWHSLHAVRDHSLGWILTHFGANDHCIPLTALDWILSRTVGLSETGMRLVPLAAGIGAVPILALLLRRHLGTRSSLVFALLLAISPLEVFYSRFARPYEVVFLLALVAVLAFERWWSGGARVWGWIYVGCAALGVWFHLVVAPFVLAPVAWGLLPPAARRGRRERAEVAQLGVLACFGMVLLVGPPFLGDSRSLEERSFGRAKDWPDPQLCFQLFSGTFRPLCDFVFALALLMGAIVLRHGARTLAPWLVTACLAQLALPLLARPAVLEEAPVLVRYVLPAHGLVLVCAALGLARIDHLARKEFPRLPRELTALILCGLGYAFGPLPWIHRAPNNWTSHQMYQANYARSFPSAFARTTMGKTTIPPIYADLAAEARAGEVLLEAPWFQASPCVPYPFYQRVHRLPYLAGFVTPEGQPSPEAELPPHDARFRFANFAFVGDLDDLRARHVRFVLFHRDRPISLADDTHVELRHVEGWIARYKQQVGAPRYEDATLSVFDLAPEPARRTDAAER